MSFTPRDYQAKCKAAVLADFDKHRSTLVVMPTGTGKTQVFLSVGEEFLRRYPNKHVLVVPHLQELVSQTALRWKEHFGGEYPAIEMGNFSVNGEASLFEGTIDDRLVIATIQTLRSGRLCKTCTRTCLDCKGEGERECPVCHGDGCNECKEGKIEVDCKSCQGDGWLRVRDDCPDCFEGYRRRMLKFNPDEVSLVAIDEAHHSPASSYRLIARYFGQNVKILGVTATPDRVDELALREVFESVAYEYSLEQAIDDGWLVDIEQQYIVVDGLDFSKVRTTAGDLNEGDLEEIIREEEMLHKFLTPMIELAGDEPTLVFMPGVASAQRAAEILNRHRPNSAACIVGSTPSDLRRDLIKRYQNGQLQYLTGCGVFLEGFDAPPTSVICLGRPTKSRALYAQAIGRGTRPLRGLVDGLATPEERRAAIASSSKKRVLVLDFVGNSGKHKLVSTADILGGKYPPEIVAKAVSQMQESGQAADMREMLAKVDEEQKRLSKLAAMEATRKRREAEARAAQNRAPIVANGAVYQKTQINAFDVLDLAPRREPPWHRGRPLTEGMREALCKFGVPHDDIPKDFWPAHCLIEKLIERRKAGLCSYKQAKQLKKQGLPYKDVPFEAASQVMELLNRNGWKLEGPDRENALALCGAGDAWEIHDPDGEKPL